MLTALRPWPAILAATGLCLVLASTGGCSKAAFRSSMSDSIYIETMSALIALKNTPGTDPEETAKARTEAMAKNGVTLEDLEDKARALAEDPSRLLQVWGKVREKLQAVGG